MTPRRYELTDFEWSIIAPLLPNKPRGVPGADERKVLNGIYWRLRAYDSDALRKTLAERGAFANVKPMPGRVQGDRVKKWVTTG